MVRTLVEIVSFGKFNFFDDKLLYYRGLADQGSLRQEYIKNMNSLASGKDKGKVTYNFNAGYLKKQGLKYFIIPAQVIGGQQFKKIKREKGPNKQYCFQKNNNGSYRVISGPMPSKKHDWLINPPDFNQKPIEIPDIDILSYQNDSSRYAGKENDDRNKQDGDLLRMIRVYHDQLIPCFYVIWKDSEGRDRVSFGHTGYFRLAYKKAIGDHIPTVLKETATLDIAEAIFGKLGEFAGRVFFEDAVVKPGEKTVFGEKVSPKVLGSPKPTTFQHYLEQEGVRTLSELKHWNSDAKIRGYKLYWHKDPKDQDWSEGRVIEDNVHTVIKPLKPGVQFKFTIRFENLAAYELGALLFVLDLPKGCYHKLGMGKPLGLGTIAISPKLLISDRKKRYTQLFSDLNWELALRETESKQFKEAFEKYVLKIVDKDGNLPSLWGHKRLKQLATILNWNNTKQSNWPQKTRYLEREEFEKRPILNSPEKYTE